MKIRTFLKCTLMAAGVLVATAFQANAQGQGGGGRGGGFGVLTQEQRSKMREAIQDDLQPLMEKLLAAEKDAAKTALDENASESAIKAKLDAVAKVQAEIAAVRIKGLKAIASTLTSDQKEQLSNLRDGGYNALLGGFMGGRGGGRGGRRGGNNNQ